MAVDMTYTLMHGELEVMELELHPPTGDVVAAGRLHAPEHLPVGVGAEGHCVGVGALYRWWSGRAIPRGRQGLKDSLERLGVYDPTQLPIRSYGLSLTDQYWVRPAGQELRWADINFFENPFPPDVGDILLGHKTEGSPDLRSPDTTTDGMLKKRWKTVKNQMHLVKGGTRPFLQEPLNEVCATRLHHHLGLKHVPYQYMLIDEEPYSICPNFVTARTELVTAWQISQALPQDRDTTRYEHFMRCCQHLGIPGMKRHLDRMLAADFLLANEDRHMGNFGALRDAQTLQWQGPAPAYDTGACLWHKQPLRFPEELEDCPAKPFAPLHSQQILLATSLDWLDPAALDRAAGEMRVILEMPPGMLDERRIGAVMDAFGDRCRRLQDIAAEHTPLNGPRWCM